MVAQDGPDRADDPGPVNDLERKECAFRDHVEVKTVEKHDPPEFVRKDGPGYGDLLNICFQFEDDQVVKFIE